MIKIKQYIPILIIAAFASTMIFQSCEKDPDDPDNPYDNVDYSVDSMGDPNLDPASIQGLHKNIFSFRCANPGCHDGSFEPDFRTVQSTYSTLVYQPVIKNNPNGDFKYRVIPGDTAMSWLHERLLTNDSVLGRMPLYANPLTDQEMANIEKWILDGAKDMFGNVTVLPPIPNQQPYLLWFLPTTIPGNSLDSTREDNIFYNPFKISVTDSFNLFFLAEDDSTLAQDLTNVRFQIADDINDFSNATTYQCQSIFVPFLGYLWAASVDASVYTPGKWYFIRFFCNDGDNTDDMEYPNEDTPNYYKTYYSFKAVN